MSILLDEDTVAVVQGATGRIGTVQTEWILDAGTDLVAGVTPGRGGSTVAGLPVYDTVETAVEKHDANASVIFVPAPFTKDAVLEAASAGLELVVTITEHVPVHDSIQMRKSIRESGAYMVGPNTPGVISPRHGKLGIMPANMFKDGRIGVISRSGTLSYEVAGTLLEEDFGVSTMVGIGGDPVIGMNMFELVELYEEDPETEAIVIIGEIGGDQEQKVAEQLNKISTPVFAYIAGKTAPKGRKMGHAGALVRGEGTAQKKIDMLREAGAGIAENPSDLPALLQAELG